MSGCLLVLAVVVILIFAEGGIRIGSGFHLVGMRTSLFPTWKSFIISYRNRVGLVLGGEIRRCGRCSSCFVTKLLSELILVFSQC